MVRRLDPERGLFAAEKRALAPPSDLPVSEWAERHVVLPPGHGNVMPGPLSLSITPHLVEPLDILSNPHVRVIVLMLPSQVGKTTFAIIALCYWHSENPGDCMWVMPNIEQAVDFNTERFLPVIRASFPGLVSGRKHDERGRMFKSVNGMATRFRGANAAAGLSSDPMRYLVFDEVGKFPDVVGKEADPIALGRSRIKNSPNSIELMTSTPVEPEDLIVKEFETTDQREYHLPCVACGAYGELSMDRDAVGMHRVFWPADATAQDIGSHSLAWLECFECGHKHTESDRISMIDAGGLWVPKDAAIEDGKVVGVHENPTRVGFHLSQLCVRWTSMSEVAQTFVAAAGNRIRLQDFENSWMGRPFASVVKTVRKSDLERLRLAIEPETAPDETSFLIGTADVQEHVIYYVVRAYAPGRTWLVKEGFVETFDQLDLVFCHAYPRATITNDYPPMHLALIDSRYRTKEVLDFCRPQAHRMWEARPIQGSAQMTPDKPFQKKAVDAVPRGYQTVGGMESWTINVSMFKDYLARLQQGTLSGESRTQWWMHRDPSTGYLREMDSEHKVRNRKTGKEVWEVKTKGRPNHRFDCEVYQMAAAQMLSWWAMDAPGSATAPPPPSRGEGRGEASERGFVGSGRKRRRGFLDV